MKEKPEHNSPTRQEDYLVATLLDFFRDPRASFSFLHAAKIALNVLARDSAIKASLLEKRFVFYASNLKDNVSANALRDFTEKCSLAAKKNGALSATEITISPPTMQTLKKRAKEDLTASMRLGYSQGAAINRAANELVKNRRKDLAKERLAESVRSHPLRDTLEGVMGKEQKLAKEDIRNQLLRLQRHGNEKGGCGGILFGLLAKAKAFSAPRLHRLLGDELFFLCRPTGFLDSKGSTLIVEVPTSAHLHILTYRKLDILRALKEDSAFISAKKIHFKVTTSTF